MGGVLGQVRFELKGKSSEFEIGGRCSGTGWIWTQREKVIGEGVFWTKLQNRMFLPIWSKNSGSLACLCITDSLLNTTYVQTNYT